MTAPRQAREGWGHPQANRMPVGLRGDDLSLRGAETIPPLSRFDFDLVRN